LHRYLSRALFVTASVRVEAGLLYLELGFIMVKLRLQSVLVLRQVQVIHEWVMFLLVVYFLLLILHNRCGSRNWSHRLGSWGLISVQDLLMQCNALADDIGVCLLEL